MGAALGDGAVDHDDDLVRAFDGRQAVRDDERRAAGLGLLEGLLDELLRGRVEGARGLVEEEDPRPYSNYYLGST